MTIEAADTKMMSPPRHFVRKEVMGMVLHKTCMFPTIDENSSFLYHSLADSECASFVELSLRHTEWLNS